jgi:DnaJ-class molecular chaperone
VLACVAGPDGRRQSKRAQAAASPEAHGPRECMACRGTGRVISNLGGTQSKAPCPWCRGGGMRVTGIDSQERWLGHASGADGHAR